MIFPPPIVGQICYRNVQSRLVSGRPCFRLKCPPIPRSSVHIMQTDGSNHAASMSGSPGRYLSLWHRWRTPAFCSTTSAITSNVLEALEASALRGCRNPVTLFKCRTSQQKKQTISVRLYHAAKRVALLRHIGLSSYDKLWQESYHSCHSSHKSDRRNRG